MLPEHTALIAFDLGSTRPVSVLSDVMTVQEHIIRCSTDFQAVVQVDGVSLLDFRILAFISAEHPN